MGLRHSGSEQERGAIGLRRLQGTPRSTEIPMASRVTLCWDAVHLMFSVSLCCCCLFACVRLVVCVFVFGWPLCFFVCFWKQNLGPQSCLVICCLSCCTTKTLRAPSSCLLFSLNKSRHPHSRFLFCAFLARPSTISGPLFKRFNCKTR